MRYANVLPGCSCEHLIWLWLKGLMVFNPSISMDPVYWNPEQNLETKLLLMDDRNFKALSVVADVVGAEPIEPERSSGLRHDTIVRYAWDAISASSGTSRAGDGHLDSMIVDLGGDDVVDSREGFEAVKQRCNKLVQSMLNVADFKKAEEIEAGLKRLYNQIYPDGDSSKKSKKKRKSSTLQSNPGEATGVSLSHGDVPNQNVAAIQTEGGARLVLPGGARKARSTKRKSSTVKDRLKKSSKQVTSAPAGL